MGLTICTLGVSPDERSQASIGMDRRDSFRDIVFRSLRRLPHLRG